jgi:AcrR family transcriptional regulator
MTPIEGSRPGGRSARIQEAVHTATKELLAATNRDDLTIPAIAARAGVNPTTVYRRWGDLPALLSDVAADRFRQTEPPAETGSLEGDLAAWAEQFLEEMASGPGRSYVADVLAGDATGDNAGICARYAAESVATIVQRFPAVPTPATDEVLDHVVAPILYRILFTRDRPTAAYAAGLVSRLLTEGAPEAG